MSAWFYEDPDEPEYLFTVLKINDLKNSWMGGLYGVFWKFNGNLFTSLIGLGLQSSPILPLVGRSSKYLEPYPGMEYINNMPTCDFNIDKDSMIITWKILKNNIGNPEQGDVLYDTEAQSCFFSNFGLMSFLRYFSMFQDLAPFGGYGANYTIQY